MTGIQVRPVALIACLLTAGPLFAQTPPGAVGAALGAASQPKVATPPAASSVKAGEGGGSANGPKTLEEAFAACDMLAVLTLGGGKANDALRVMAGQGRLYQPAIMDSAAWTRTGDSFALFWLKADGTRIEAGSGGGGFSGWAPPDIAALPIADDIFPPPVYPPQTEGEKAMAQSMLSAWNAAGRNAVGGMSAPDAARAYYAALPQMQSAANVYDLSQADYVRCTAFQSTRSETPAVCIRAPVWGATGNEVRTWVTLYDGTTALDPQKFPGYASLPWIDDPRPGLKIPAEVERRRALPPPPPRPAPPPRPPARNC